MAKEMVKIRPWIRCRKISLLAQITKTFFVTRLSPNFSDESAVDKLFARMRARSRDLRLKKILTMKTQKTSWFTRFAQGAARAAGKPVTFVLAFSFLILWAVVGPVFQFSNTWQLVVNTGTTIVTFLMVFLIQNTQNRDTEALQIKLDELIRANRAAKNSLLDLEELEEAELDKIRNEYEELARQARLVGDRRKQKP